MDTPRVWPDPPLTVHHARGFWTRLAGLLARRELRKGEALYLAPCTAVHTWFMPYAIDVVFVDRMGRVLRVAAVVPPWRAVFCRAAHGALELRAGQASCYGIAPGALLDRALLGDGA
jgi:uncharacterized membrane protein (UPF0127 family)